MMNTCHAIQEAVAGICVNSLYRPAPPIFQTKENACL